MQIHTSLFISNSTSPYIDGFIASSPVTHPSNMSAHNIASPESEVQALKHGGDRVAISDYLLTRLEQLGVKVNTCITSLNICNILMSHLAYVRCPWRFQFEVPREWSPGWQVLGCIHNVNVRTTLRTSRPLIGWETGRPY